jgi:hypothetical protein
VQETSSPQPKIHPSIVGARTIEELYASLVSVLERLDRYNVKVNFEKCHFFVDKVSYLGHKIPENGISPNYKKVEAIAAAPEPQNVTQLQSFIGLLNYYSKFIPSFSKKISCF